MSTKPFLSYLVFFSIVFSSYAQNHEFGSLTDWEKNYALSDEDDRFKAVVLYERGDVYFDVIDNTIRMVKEYHKKIKILDRKGFDEANIAIPFYFTDESSEKVKNIRAITHNGNSKQNVLWDKVYKVDVDKNNGQMRFTFPDVQVGSILEYQYTLVSPYFYRLEGWTFQEDIPKAYSEFNAKIPRNYQYNRSLVGPLTLDIDESYIQNACFELPEPWEAADCEVLYYVMKNILPFENEDFMLSPKNFISRLEFELSEFFTLDRIRKKYTKSWKDVDNDYKKEDIGKQLAKTGFFKNNLPSELLNEKDPLLRAEKVFNFVKNHFIWNGDYGIHKDLDVKDAFGKGTGNIGEINVSLVNFLEAAGIDALPVLLSTRDYGLPKKTHPVIYDFNYLIAKIEVNGKEIFLDASERVMPFGTLPFRCLNYYGRVMDFKKGSYWQDIKPENKNNVTFRVQLKLDIDQNKASGIFDEINMGYFAIDKRKLLRSMSNETHYLEDKQEKLDDDIYLTSYRLFEERNHDKLVSERFGFEIEDVLEGDVIYLNPFLTQSFEKNPFQLKERTYPVDFGYARSYDYQANIDIPEGYYLKSLPEKTKVELEKNLGSLKLDYQTNGSKILISLSVKLNSAYVPPESYESLKKMFGNIIDLERNSLIVFEKKTP